jgi:hypothetical protein
VVMIVVAVGMLGLFWKRGWIGNPSPRKRVTDER